MSMDERDWYRARSSGKTSSNRSCVLGNLPPVRPRFTVVRFVSALVLPYVFLIAACALWLFAQGAAPHNIPTVTKNWISGFLAAYPVLCLAMLAVSVLQMARPRMAGITYAWLVIGCLCFVAFGYYDRRPAPWMRLASRAEIQGAGSMLVQKNRHGHYETLGSINGYPVTFLIDTGASMTSVPGSLGRQLGVSSCEPRQFNTAGGEVTGCVTRVQELAFGTFLVQNVQVAVMPDMKGSALLGMNVLKMLKIEQQDSVLRLSTAKQH